jgi:hypothetical protein
METEQDPAVQAHMERFFEDYYSSRKSEGSLWIGTSLILYVVLMSG